MEPQAVKSARRVYVVDDNRDIRQSLHFSLNVIEIEAWSFASAQDFLDQATTLAPAPILLDVRMPGVNGLEALASLRAMEIDWPVIMMSAHGDVPIAVKSMQLGAVDFLQKPFKFENVEHLLEEAFRHIDGETEVKLASGPAKELLGKLTLRESEVMGILVNGVSNKSVAKKLGLSLRTVETHRFNAMSKLGSNNLAGVLRIMFAAEGHKLKGVSSSDPEGSGPDLAESA